MGRTIVICCVCFVFFFLGFVLVFVGGSWEGGHADGWMCTFVVSRSELGRAVRNRFCSAFQTVKGMG